MSLLEVRNLSVRFGEVHALDRVSFDVTAGTAVGLVGPNGAGKSTLIDAITGLVAPSSGSVTFDGAEVTTLAAHERAWMGLGRTFQGLELFEDLTVSENVRVAAESGAADGPPVTRWHGPGGRTENFEGAGDRLPEALPHNRRKALALTRALAAGPRLLLLDEPAAGLDLAAREALVAQLRSLTEGGVGLVVADHDLDFVFKTCPRVLVLDFGRLIADGPRDGARQAAALEAAYLGPATTRHRDAAPSRPSAPPLEPIRWDVSDPAPPRTPEPEEQSDEAWRPEQEAVEPAPVEWSVDAEDAFWPVGEAGVEVQPELTEEAPLPRETGEAPEAGDISTPLERPEPPPPPAPPPPSPPPPPPPPAPPQPEPLPAPPEPEPEPDPFRPPAPGPTRTAPGDVLLRASRIVAGYGAVTAISDVDIDVRAGEVVALLGPNAAGKTTLLRALSGLIPIREGQATFRGYPVMTAPDRLARSGMAHVPQDRAVLPSLTVWENIRLVGGTHADLERFRALPPLASRRAADISGGEQQLLALARALAAQPVLLLVDELSLGLALPAARDILDLLQDMARREGLGVLVVEQHAHLALDVADRAVVLSRGRVAWEGPAQDLVEHHEVLRAAYLGDSAQASE